MRFITDGDRIFVLTKDSKAILDTLVKGQFVFALALGEIIENLKGEVRNISLDRKYKVSVKGKSYEVVLHADAEDGGY